MNTMVKESDKKQRLFRFEGLTREGQPVTGQRYAISDAVARSELLSEGITPLVVRATSQKRQSGRRRSIRQAHIAYFFRQFATMLNAGVPLVQALHMIASGEANLNLRQLIRNISSEVEAGVALGDALALYPKYFDSLTIHLVKTGERSGSLDLILTRIANYKEKTERLKAKIKKALTYPAAVVAVGLGVSAILLYFVVPQFEQIFKSFNATLPPFTVFVIKLSHILERHIWEVIVAIVVLYFLLRFLNRFRGFRRRRDQLLFRLPVLGLTLKKAAIARFARTLQIMFSSGVPIVEALESVAGATGSVPYEDAVLEIREQVAAGQPLAGSMEYYDKLFLPMAVQMMAVGERAGALDDMSGKVADVYEAEVDDVVDNLSSLIEPLLMVVLGVLVGGLVIAMYLPIFQLGNIV